MKRAFLVGGGLVTAALALLILSNWSSLDDGVTFLQAMAAYKPAPPVPLDPQGRFGFCYQYVGLRNAQRAQFILNFLEARGIAYQRLPIYDTRFDNIFVPLGKEGGPYTLFSAHYDKVYDEPDYQGASDNSAAGCMLLVAADELHKNPPARPIAILFTGQEEVGLVGAKAFYEYAVQNDFQVGEVLNFDNIGRGGLAARASGERSGYVFTLPLLGEYVYNGRTVAQASAYRQPDSTLLERIRRRVPFAFFDRMVAKSDGTYWQDHGWNAVNISSDDMYYLDETWHTFGDRIELLDQRNLDRALKLVRDYATREE